MQASSVPVCGFRTWKYITCLPVCLHLRSSSDTHRAHLCACARMLVLPTLHSATSRPPSYRAAVPVTSPSCQETKRSPHVISAGCDFATSSESSAWLRGTEMTLQGFSSTRRGVAHLSRCASKCQMSTFLSFLVPSKPKSWSPEFPQLTHSSY